MRSLKITLTLTALVAVFLLTVSGQSSENQNGNVDTYELNKEEFKMIATGLKKNKKPNNQVI